MASDCSTYLQGLNVIPKIQLNTQYISKSRMVSEITDMANAFSQEFPYS